MAENPFRPTVVTYTCPSCLGKESVDNVYARAEPPDGWTQLFVSGYTYPGPRSLPDVPRFSCHTAHIREALMVLADHWTTDV